MDFHHGLLFSLERKDSNYLNFSLLHLKIILRNRKQLELKNNFGVSPICKSRYQEDLPNFLSSGSDSNLAKKLVRNM
jgi:hypothetical protein